MDIDESGWILEFLLRQNSLDDKTLNDLIRVLPLPNNNPKLKKSLILRSINRDIENQNITQTTIELLEQIEQLDINEGNTQVSDSMKSAYCAVALHCTAQCVERIVNSGGDKKDECASDLKRIWSSRIREMLRSNKSGLIKDEILKWVDDFEIDEFDVNVRKNVLEMCKELDVFEVVREYVNEAKEKMGPSFLEIACETILKDDGLSKAMGLDDGVEVCDHNKDGEPANSKRNGETSTHVLPRKKKIVPRCTRGPSGPKTHRGAKIVDPTETSDNNNRYNYIPSPEVNKVQEDLEISSFNLHQVVKDPLPDAIRLAESLKGCRNEENTVHDHAVGNSAMADTEAPKTSDDRKGKALEDNGDDVICGDQNNRRKPSLMERNNTAHTFEWSDSIESTEDGSPTIPHLPTPKTRAVSPLNIYKMEKLTRQRKKRKWTILEEDTLRTGVQKYGKGNWKLILGMYRDIFEDRTEVDLKDKWRNLTR
ncbi:uncharacterized protein [Rutidosis leptorrhynchoides]|uniref:uncharacterized protein n=1 Tax=Rutidosis leptorrhynchoides TaxID=125765 RepID=UPI003A997237